jgi:hypothetical protein
MSGLIFLIYQDDKWLPEATVRKIRTVQQEGEPDENLVVSKMEITTTHGKSR